jgi:hypothetical protein
VTTNDVLDQIDGAVDAWEARPESWVPGDPLYDRPSGSAFLVGEQTVRPMFQVLPQGDWLIKPRCQPCQVDWADDAPCWVCGEERPDPMPPASPVVTWRDPAPRTMTVTVDVQPYLEELRRMTELLSRTDWHAIEATLERVEPRRSQHCPLPLCIDGHDYRRRARNRRKR